MAKITIRGYHLDAYQHVNNARYLEFLEEARWQYFDNISNTAYKEMKISFFIVNININYRLPATLGDVINITTDIEKIGNTSMTFAQKIYLEGTEKVICDALITFVILDQKTEKPLRIDDNLKKLFLKKKMV
jgi:thioesterase III